MSGAIILIVLVYLVGYVALELLTDETFATDFLVIALIFSPVWVPFLPLVLLGRLMAWRHERRAARLKSYKPQRPPSTDMNQ